LDGITIAIIIVIVFVVIIFGVAFAARSRRQPSITETPPMPMTMPPQGSGSAQSSLAIDEPKMKIIRRRPPPGSDLGLTTSTHLEDPLYIPNTVQIYRNQSLCRVCKQSIKWSERRSGWARCLSTNMLVHGHCYEFTHQAHPSVPNWCTICDGTCQSQQSMRREGIAY
jgi:hypothetical protein